MELRFKNDYLDIFKNHINSKIPNKNTRKNYVYELNKAFSNQEFSDINDFDYIKLKNYVENIKGKRSASTLKHALREFSKIESDSITGLVAALRFGISSVVANEKEIIKNNYGVKDDDKDYKFTDEEMKNAVRIRIDNEKDFIISLVTIGSIGVLERENSDLFLKKKKDLKDDECDYVDIEYN